MDCEKNKKYTRTTKAQLVCYVQFVQDHPELLTGKNSPANPKCQQNLWAELANRLNTLYGPNKTVDKWKETLRNWKKQLRARARRAKASREKTGGGPFSGEELSEFEEQALTVFGISVVNGIEGAALGFENSA